jgi:hypothetical protein
MHWPLSLCYFLVCVKRFERSASYSAVALVCLLSSASHVPVQHTPSLSTDRKVCSSGPCFKCIVRLIYIG